MVANLIPHEIPGIGPEAADVTEHVLDERGNVRDFDEIAEAMSSRKWATFALLEYHIREALRKPRARGYPPKIFISYRREVREDIDWVKRLAQEIKSLGYQIYLDQMEIGTDPSEAELASFVAKLADSDIAIVVITDSYLMEGRQENSMREWLYQEWTRIQALQGWGLLELILLVRSSTGATPFVDFEAIVTKIIDVRASPDDFAPVLQFLEAYSGPSYSDADREYLAEISALAIGQARSGNHADALLSLDQIAHLADTEEYRLAEALVLATGPDRESAVARGLALLESRPTLPIAAETARSLWVLDADLQVFPYLAEMVEVPSLWRFRIHYMMADILRRNRMPYAAISHFGWCLYNAGDPELDFARGPYPEEAARHNLKARLGLLWFLVGDAQEYEAYYASAQAEDPDLLPFAEDIGLMFEAISLQSDPMVMFDSGLRCKFCRGIYYRTGYVCTSCGASYGKPHKDEVGLATRDCRMCHKKGAIVLHEKSISCAVCRIIYYNGKPAPAYFLPHGPRGLYSVLPQGPARETRLYIAQDMP